MTPTPASIGTVEIVVLLLTGILGAGGLWQWVAGRVAKADAEVATLRAEHLQALDQIGILRAEVAELRAELRSAEELRRRNAELRDQRDALRHRVDRLERRLIRLGEEITEPADDAPSLR